MAKFTDTWQVRPEVIGVYTPRRAGALAGISGQTIGQWARYGLVTPSVYEGRPRNLYSYFDVAEAIVVRWLLDEGFSHSDVRDAINAVWGEFPEWPLLNAPLGIGRQSVDDRGELVKKVNKDLYVAVSTKSANQFVIPPTLLYAARDMLQHGGWLANKLGLVRIEVEPLKLGGQPSLRGRRWTVDHVARLGADAEGRDILITQYGLDADEVDEALAWTEAAEALA